MCIEERIHRLRKEKGISQEELAEKVGVSHQNGKVNKVHQI